MQRFRRKLVFCGGALLTAFIALLFLFIDRSLEFLCKIGMSVEVVCSLKSEVKRAVLFLGAAFLSLYSLSIWILFNRLSRPLRKIADHILSYTEGGLFPTIEVEAGQTGEFAEIAAVLNAMISKIKKQMNHLSLSRMETVEIIESLSEGVLAVDTEGKTTFANGAACKVLGAAPEALLNGPLRQVPAVQNDLKLKCHEAIQDVLQTSEFVRRTWTDGKRGHIHLELTVSPRPGHRGAILVLQDKTADFKILEMGKDFIANASHELRTPITILRGFAETLQDHPELSFQTLKSIAEKIVRTSHRLENLVKSLLTLTYIENYSPDQMQTIDLVAIANNCKQFATAAHPTARIDFQSDLNSASIAGDPHLLDLAIMNLIENGIKYSRSPAEIVLSLRKEENGTVQIAVQDKGIGIPDADQPYVFDRFYTVDKARARKSGGAGLGLSIVKTIVEKHQGTVSVASHLGRGSAFTMTFPLSDRHHFS
jgi:two-component system, OmpR family, phosphate regulon sensor histidine kinase PhoR